VTPSWSLSVAGDTFFRLFCMAFLNGQMD
jgi:hypothetical protein